MRVITYNILEGFGDAEVGRFLPGEERRRHAYRWLQECGPDLIAFQELNGYSVDRLEADARLWGHQNVALLSEIPCRIGVTSRYDLEILERHHQTMHHGLIVCRVHPDGAEPITLIATHLWPFSGEERLREVVQVLRRAGGQTDESRIIMLGDFNAFSPLDRGRLTEELLARYRGWNWEWVNGEPSYAVVQAILDAGFVDLYDRHAPRDRSLASDRVDFIFASPQIARSCTRVRWLAEEWRGDPLLGKLSDHFPLLADIALE